MTSPTVAANIPQKDAAEDEPVPIRRFGRELAAAVLKRCARLLPTDWRILLWSKETDETLLASLGPVQIRQMPACCVAQTSVKGGMDVARGTALQRLAKYVGGENRRAVALEAERPILQQRTAPGLWQIIIRLLAIDDVYAAPAPRSPKIKLSSQQSTTCAVITQSGHPTEWRIARAEMAILEAIARTPWFPTGAPVVRIHVPCSILPFAGSFEVAVSVSYQSVTEAPPTSRPVSAASPSVH